MKVTGQHHTFDNLKVFEMESLRLDKGEVRVTFTRPFEFVKLNICKGHVLYEDILSVYI